MSAPIPPTTTTAAPSSNAPNQPASGAPQPPSPATTSPTSLAISLAPSPATVPVQFGLSPRQLSTFIGPVFFCHRSVSSTGVIRKPTHGLKDRKPLKSRTNGELLAPRVSLYESALEKIKDVHVGWKTANGTRVRAPIRYRAGFWMQECAHLKKGELVFVGYLETSHENSQARLFFRDKMCPFEWVPEACHVPFAE
ncbi:hypothetical protein EXIGLDRAFT_724073 [Exidia glandulosa HHB12029]|uniref:Uncharacterized protein n=1 Tax=Exidia glandulosa HHB12029 TaxID=1314781 RepID=A0A165EK25_EXIGL|nr:hypothetical protein EXIGLDRAFT_724073 [Exidia glandulosa HHB12029]